MSRSSTKTTSTTDFSLHKLDPEAHQVWRWRRLLKIGKTKDHGDLKKCYEAMPKGMYTRNEFIKEEFRELVTGPRPHFLNPYELESIFVPKHKTKKEVRGSKPARKRRLISGSYNRTRGRFQAEQAKGKRGSMEVIDVLQVERPISPQSRQNLPQLQPKRFLFDTTPVNEQEGEHLDEGDDWEHVLFEFDASKIDSDPRVAYDDDFFLVWEELPRTPS
ncbi:hypothetical protein VTL71DRAFT_13864 [Oculimacula yallundae]|uniref:Uncharacterized protein n=1 Tax=Oculimacula yallundae TaxID=86028 RepID=A0ABR4CNG8_9HELO